ncbi:MAG: hypothetical protein HQK87_07660, partial [Nitrospinae bacterium]|nr:hypothetical protein [Nitrospinota bacterium]
GLQLGGSRVSGDFAITLDQSGADKVWTITANNADLALAAGGAQVGIEHATGSLVLGPGNTRSGSFSGAAMIDGLSGVSLAGNLTAAFDQGAITLTGTGMALALGEFGVLNGDFTVSRQGGAILIGATGVSASFGSGNVGLAVSNLDVGVYIDALSESRAGYALVANGTANLTGFNGITLNAAASVRVNTLGRTLDVTVNGVVLQFTQREPVQEVAITNGNFTVAGLGSLQGNLAILNTPNDLLVGLSGASGTLTLGGIGATLTSGSGAVLLRKTGVNAGKYALQAEGSVALTGISGVTLTAPAMQVNYNRLGEAVVNREITLGNGTTRQVNLLDNETRLRGSATAAVAGLTVQGEIFVESIANVASKLAGGGQAVSLDQLVFGGTGLTASVGAGDAVAALSGIDLAMVLSTEQNATRRWLTSKANLGGISLAGYTLSDLQSAALNINQALDANGALDATAQVLDWSGTQARTLALSAADAGRQAVIDMVDRRYEIPVNGAIEMGPARLAGNFTVILDKDGAGNRIWDIKANGVEVAVAAGGSKVAISNGAGDLYLSNATRSGSLSGNATLSGLAGVGLSGAFVTAFNGNDLDLSGTGVTLTLDGFGAMTGNFAVEKSATALKVGMSGVTGNFGAGVAVTNGTLGLYMARDGLGRAGYALMASGTASLSGYGGIAMSADAMVRVNTMGDAVDQSVSVAGAPIAISFADGRALQELVITSGTLTVTGLGSLTGALAIRSQTVGDVTELRIGVAGMTGTLGLGGLAAAMTDVTGAVLLKKAGAVQGGFALQVEGGFALTGADGLTVTADRVQVACNRLGEALENVIVATGSQEYVLNLLVDESRVRGHMTVDLAGVLSVDGEVFLESRVGQTVSLTDGGGDVTVDQLLFGGAGIGATLGTGAMGAALRDVEMGVVLSRETTGSQRRWLTGKARVGGATLAGYGLAEVNIATLEINARLVNGAPVLGGTDPVVDWSAHQLGLALSPDVSVTLDAGRRLFELMVDGAMQFGPAKVAGTFLIVMEQSAQGERAWHLVASDVEVGLEANGARVGLSHGTGDLYLGRDNVSGVWGDSQRSGIVTGTASVTGVDGLALTGQFATRFDSQGNLELAGAVDVDLAGGYARLSGEFAVSQSQINRIDPAIDTRAADAGVAGTVTEETRGGVQSDSLFHLDVASADGSRSRDGEYLFYYGQALASVVLSGTDNSQWRARLRNALQLLFGTGNVEVTGDRQNGFDIALIGQHAGTAVTGLTMTQPADPAFTANWGTVSVEKQATSSSGAIQRIDPIPANTEGSHTLGFDFNIKTNSKIELAAYSGGAFREGRYGLTLDGRTVYASTISSGGVQLADAAFAGQLRTSLETLIGAGTVSVTGGRATGFVIEFQGAMAGVPIQADATPGGTGLYLTPPVDPSASLATSGGTRVESQAIAAALSSQYQLEIVLPNGGTNNSDGFTFQFTKSLKSASAKFTNAQETQARQIFEALAKLVPSGASTTTAYASGSVVKVVKSDTITVKQMVSPSNDQIYTIAFADAIKDQVLALGPLTVSNTGVTASIAYLLSPVTAGVVTSSATGAVHLVDRFPADARGNFTLSLQYNGQNYATGSIGLNASAAQVQTALASVLPAGVTVTVSVDAALNAWRVAFGGDALGKAIPQMTRVVTPRLAPQASLTTLVSGAISGAGTYTTAPLDFHADATTIQTALAAARNENGMSFGSTGATVAVALDAASGQYRVTFGGSAVGQEIPAMTRIVAPLAAPNAHLTQTTVGATTSEAQRITLGAGTGYFQLALGNLYSTPLRADGLTADALSTALAGIAGGVGNVSVVKAADGSWEVHFQNALAGQNVASLRVMAVQSIDLTMNDGKVADVVRHAAWAQNLELTGKTNEQIRVLLEQSLQTLPGIGRHNVTVATIGENGRFLLLGAGALAGRSLPAVTLGLSRAVEQPPNYLLVGAASVNAFVGAGDAGVALTNTKVGLILSRDTPPVLGGIAPKPGYALVASGVAGLQGFDSAVTLVANAELRVNALGRAIDMAVKTGLTTPDSQVTFADGIARKEVTITNGALAVTGLGTLNGAFKLVTATQTQNGVTTTDLAIGINALGGYLKPGGVGVTLANGSGAIVLRNTTEGAVVTNRYAVAAEGDVTFDVVPGLELSANRLDVAWNRWGSALDANVATASGNYTLHLADNETRLRGQMHAAVSGALELDGQMFIESKLAQSARLSDS